MPTTMQTRERYELADDNPLTGTPLCECRFADLPGYVMDEIRRMGVTPDEWNTLVEQGTVLEQRGLDGWHLLPKNPNAWRDLPSRGGWPGAAR